MVTRLPEVDGVRLSLSLRLNATTAEVHDALVATEAAGMIEQVRPAGLMPMWRLP